MNTDPQDLLALANEAIATAQLAEGSPAFKNLAPLLYRLGRAVQCFRADTLRAAPVAVGWIRISERLPPQISPVYFVAYGCVRSGMFRDVMFHCEYGTFPSSEVTHWQPWTLPELPKEEATAHELARKNMEAQACLLSGKPYHGSQTHAAVNEQPKPTEPSAEECATELCKWPRSCPGGPRIYLAAAALLRSQARELATRPTHQEIDAVRKERDAEKSRAESAELSRDQYWTQLCETVEAMGKLSPEAAPFAARHARELKARTTAAEAKLAAAEAAMRAALASFNLPTTKEDSK